NQPTPGPHCVPDPPRIDTTGVVLLDMDLLSLEIDQCAERETGTIFAGSHRCRQESTRCVNIPGNGLRWGSYECQCKPEFYFPDSDAENKSFKGRQVELAYLDRIKNNSFNYTQGFMCLPCRKGCENCEGDEPCIVEFDVLLRGIPLGIQSFCMTIALVVGIVIARLRKTKVMRSSVWVLLEMIVLGALLLYATVVIQYFEPTATNCLLVPWFREVGFAIFYGTLVLKIYSTETTQDVNLYSQAFSAPGRHRRSTFIHTLLSASGRHRRSTYIHTLFQHREDTGGQPIFIRFFSTGKTQEVNLYSYASFSIGKTQGGMDLISRCQPVFIRLCQHREDTGGQPIFIRFFSTGKTQEVNLYSCASFSIGKTQGVWTLFRDVNLYSYAYVMA
ncbi:hypothetical protein BaRGS_00002187, partial [Batillaria attramentaria]